MLVSVSHPGKEHTDSINKAFTHLLLNSQLGQFCQPTQINGQEVITGLTQSLLHSCVGE